MPANEVTRKKKLSDQRKVFWRSVIDKKYSNVKFIFVSEYFKNEFVTDICDGKQNFNYEVIHNYIDSELFEFHEKRPEDAFKVLSIRPFSSLTYANDLTVKAIVELTKTPDFDKFQFTIVGDGDLFDGTVEPVKQFKNVTLRKEFLTQAQIAELHKEHGVFLVPTRMDTQGVSRGEAMSSGLVGVTTAVAAIPEFVSDNDGVVVDAEDYAALSKALLQLTDSDVFVKLSRNGSERVKSQCSLKNTIKKELDLFVRNN
ncbi:MAG: glycosyltransferase family 4 protein [Alcaligenaceae bacterium]|nr:glycosyltransferase family 4 protein [Alcaligenaceae bacterium]